MTLTDAQKRKLAQVSTYAVNHARGGMLPSVFAAQAILESGCMSGGSTLADVYNNYFGIKAGSSWTGKTVNLKTREETKAGESYCIKDNFRVYDTMEDSFRDRAELLLKSARYKDAYTKTTPKEQAEALQKAGYATANNYADSICRVIQSYGLEELDKKKRP